MEELYNAGETSVIPETEPERQYYYMEKARKLLAGKKREAGRPLTFCVVTFGCQMNARIPRSSGASWKRSAMLRRTARRRIL